MNEKEKEKFIEIMEAIKELRLRKSKDYGTSWKVWGLDGIVWQIRSKFIRMQNLLNSKEDPANEPLKDTFMDMANYCIMAIQLIESKETENQIDKILKINQNKNV